ncbi:MAG: type II toxin-antitoxin system VapC family toxin [Microthrixaceae bacterium]
MITYIDTSVLMKLLVLEEGTDAATQIWDASDSLVSVSLVQVEGHAALAAAARAGRLSRAQLRRTRASLAELLDQMALVQVTAELVDDASELADVEQLRGYDAVHLAGALLVTADVMASADDDLCVAAGNRGLLVANPLGPA